MKISRDFNIKILKFKLNSKQYNLARMYRKADVATDPNLETNPQPFVSRQTFY